ncbi:YcgL domain [Anaerobiospirillum thomasii]|uniref:YcgL domain n=1 Tax=Anaerobiospirillum thomasii TaxID=179995 RepID=A0A2X0V331_9GAMM|nr:YcgL domain-containing protein [Anaerobiospirillum thomasii]SPT68333.1 YcgL domain [Anaerobiospirillum thomasii]SPT70828.1 YcgL domain [Anaerobiospirillum thomasii]
MAQQLVYVYKSSKKLRSYLYIKEKDVFSHIPSGLLDAFGTPQFVMMFALHEDRVLPKIKAADLMQALNDKGYFVRIDLDDPEENMLNIERKRLGLPPLEKDKIADYFH